jgi:hypothetical protein
MVVRNKILKVFGVGCTLAVATVFITITLHPQTSGHHAAFTANQVYTILSGGSPVKTVGRTMVGRADGSNAEYLTMSGEWYLTFFDASTKRVISVDPQLKYASVRPAGQQEALRYLALYPDCMSKYGGGVMNAVCTPGEKMLGFDTIAVVRSPKPDPSSEFRYWAAPALNYFPLREAKYKNGELIETVETTSVTLEDPDPKLFVVPDDYRMATRADYYRASKQSVGQVPDQKMLDFLEKDWQNRPVSLDRPRPASSKRP